MNERNIACMSLKRFTVIIAIIICLIGISTAEAKINVWGVRSELWLKLSSIEKTFYLQGVLDGLIFAHSQVQGEEISYNTSLEHLTKAIDQFYNDYRNALIPVPFALKVISMELAGRGKGEIDSELETLRKVFLNIEKSKAL